MIKYNILDTCIYSWGNLLDYRVNPFLRYYITLLQETTNKTLLNIVQMRSYLFTYKQRVYFIILSFALVGCDSRGITWRYHFFSLQILLISKFHILKNIFVWQI